MIHLINNDELRLHERSVACRCNPVIDIDEFGEPFCIHLPLSINLKSITDAQDSDEPGIPEITDAP